ncbi:MAG: bifunctional adenosylcobinamide kinase/adenosylcobinamide-phosphate guanylyltransferase [Chloroflexi bacterium]|nr:MAG: bifunctional adenosylcobinamide kinase/adenosylcobinamide-phosphate guanylyltransferase [Chloroflexota bacterium]
MTLILGGARSGKSSYALKLAKERSERVLFVATAVAFDDEMSARIAAHKAEREIGERTAGWRTLEAPREVGAAIHAAESGANGDTEVLLLDCITLLANNVILALPDPEDAKTSQAALDAEIDGLLEAYTGSSSEWIVVSNEVGLGLVPAYPLGRVYRDVLGRANQKLAQAASRVIFMVAGIPMIVK